jgi:hypothetical protein
MSITVAGFVKNGVVVPNAPLPEGAFVEVRVVNEPIEVSPELQEEFDAWNRASADALESVPAADLTPAALRRMPREQRQAILAAAAELAEPDYRSDKDLTGFEAFSEEELNDDESDSG